MLCRTFEAASFAEFFRKKRIIQLNIFSESVTQTTVYTQKASDLNSKHTLKLGTYEVISVGGK